MSHASATHGLRVLVTGANGFIGGRLVEKLVENGAAVTCLLRSPANARLAGLDVAISNIDAADELCLLPKVLETDIIFHCAFDGIDEDWNFRAIRSLMSCCSKGQARLVHVSSFVVYDIPTAGELTEDSPDTKASAGYARIKLDLEREVFGAVERGGLWATVVQPTIVYGPGSKPWTIEPVEMLRYGTVVLPDSNIGICNAVHVDDVVGGMIAASQSDAALGQRFLISGEPITWAEFYEALAAAAGTPRPEYLSERKIAASYAVGPSLSRALANPLAFLRKFCRRRKIRKMLQVLLASLPKALREKIHGQIFAPLSRQRGYVHLPSLGFVQNQSTIMSGKARATIGYSPQIDFDEGVFSMMDYLKKIC